MHVPRCGGPPPRRHDFEEMFTVLDGGAQAAFIANSQALAPEYKTELHPPPGAR